MSGDAHGVGSALLRAGLSVIEPFYAGVAGVRNRLFDAGWKQTHRLARPVISIGNLTAGGTGKTPMVRWLAEQLRAGGKHVAILSRGYKASAGTLGDELALLDRALNAPGNTPVLLRANPNRIAAGEALLAEHPEIDVFLLDDGFQHRKLARDLDVVLINAAEPFGFDHVLPRGLLRERLTGLRRASAVVLTRCDTVDAHALHDVERRVRQHNPIVPIYRTVHAQTGFRHASTPTSAPIDELMGAIASRRWFVFSGIGNPAALRVQLARHGGECVGARSFTDHHAYGANDLRKLNLDARQAGAEVIITTEKDWSKIAPLTKTLGSDSLPIWRVDVEIRFQDAGDSALLDQVRAVLRDGNG